VSDDEWRDHVDGWLPTAADRDHVASLMHAVTEPGRMAGWVAPPSRGIHQKPIDYEYVRI
jgi:benzoyl-CoA 2,3-dioxygenase component B